jgi:tRNA-Thr(GGU) m(6)t(6)A37 methyltransferase TsaA
MSCVPIGHIHSCFAEKNGTPRQGSICPASRATLELKLPGTLIPEHSVEGLEQYSHVWLLWQFHQNGPAAIRSKVSPPRLDGVRVGLFATRTPHRPNAIGLSAVKLERIDGCTLHLSGVDLIEGTPILDVKPYVPLADSLPPADVRVPYWLRPETAPVSDLEVEVTEEAREQIRALRGALSFFASEAEAEAAIQQVLRAEPRSVFWRHAHADEMYGFSIDQLNVICRFEGIRAIVTRVEHLALCDRAHLHKPTGDDRSH